MDVVDEIWEKFFATRTKSLWDRVPGHYRALVVETNDPLNMHRVKIKCPDLHDWDIDPADCQWAVPSFDMGTKRAGRWSSPCIGDWVWITFERSHPYAPIWTGFADPTRRKFYPYPAVFNVSPIPLNADGKPLDEAPQDYNKIYLPSDGRPMSHGWQDRYGNLDITSSVGFFPVEHDFLPPPPEHDAIQGADFAVSDSFPLVNIPDVKYMARVTKYGNMLLLGDQGYYWRKTGPGETVENDPEGELGEFRGDVEKDEEFETNRWLYLQRLLNEDRPLSSFGGDQRRSLMLTRYGHKFEMRDVGWAQMGPIKSKSRPEEYGEPRVLSTEDFNDFRWIKLRTKAGMLYQASDKGADPAEDEFINRLLIDEVGPATEREDEFWRNKDARWMRLVTRYGFKIVLDDRGSDPRRADKQEYGRGNGILIKGRRTPAANARPAEDDPRGFFWEFNENDEANHTMWGSPMGAAVEMNDRYQYAMMVSTMGTEWTAPWRGLEENEFIRKPLMINDPENNSHHLKLDLANEYVRLKTRANRGTPPENGKNPSDVLPTDLSQGLEARDGKLGRGPWVEVVDSQHRGMWWSRNEGLGIWRAKTGVNMYTWMDDANKMIVIFNDEDNGKIQIFANGNVDIMASDTLNLRSDRDINLWAGEKINMWASGSKLSVHDNAIFASGDFNAATVNAFLCGAFPGDGAGCPNPGGEDVDRVDKPNRPDVLEPDDRGKSYNGPFVECPPDEVEHPIK